MANLPFVFAIVGIATASSMVTVSTLGGQGPAGDGFVDGTLTTAKFYNPGGISLDGNGNLYVVDDGNHAIRLLAPSAAPTSSNSSSNDSSNSTSNSSSNAATPVPNPDNKIDIILGLCLGLGGTIVIIFAISLCRHYGSQVPAPSALRMDVKEEDVEMKQPR